MLYGVVRGIDYFLEIVRYGLLLYCVLGWFVSPFNSFMKLLTRIFDPILRPVRNILFRIMPRMPIDLSAIALFFVIDFARNMVWRLYWGL